MLLRVAGRVAPNTSIATSEQEIIIGEQPMELCAFEKESD